MNYSVNIESLYKNFPADCVVPSLLLEFGSWLKTRRAGSVGYFSLQSDRFNDNWFVPFGKSVRESFQSVVFGFLPG